MVGRFAGLAGLARKSRLSKIGLDGARPVLPKKRKALNGTTEVVPFQGRALVSVGRTTRRLLRDYVRNRSQAVTLRLKYNIKCGGPRWGRGGYVVSGYVKQLR